MTELKSISVVLFALLAGWLGSASAAAEQADLAARGKQLALVCSGCHSLAKEEPHAVGPNLWNVVGRRVAGVAGFDYSDAFRRFDGRWTAENLDRYLAAPASFIPNNRMAFSGIGSAADRAAVVAYLESLRPGGAKVNAATAFDYGGLKAGDGREDVYSVCSRCHSIMLVKQQGMNRDRWDEVLEWMVEEQGMDPLNDAQQQRVLDYLSKHYGG